MKKIFLVPVIIVLLASCVGNRKISAAKAKLAAITAQMQQEKNEIAEINQAAEAKLSVNKIDSTIQNKIGIRLNKASIQLDSAQKQVDWLTEILLDKKSTRKNYRKIIVPLLDSLQQQSDLFAKRLALYLMIRDGLNVADFKLFDLAAFFGPGKYIIPEDKIDIASQSFKPVVDSLMLFSNKYSQYPRTATLIILGFADGTGISKGGELYYTLLDALRKPEANDEELNQKISELRAEELIKQLTNLYIKNAAGFKEIDKLHIVYLGQGKGEQYPLSYIKDYKTDDDRRRIVLCYWVVLPD